jgi:uncharacterized protein YqeY
MSIKATIQADFVTAMKEKNETGKTALSSLKAKITEAEKANGNTELADEAIIKVINTAIKQRKESADAFLKGNRNDLAIKELAEVEAISKYLPTQMTEAEIKTAVSQILSESTGGVANPQIMIGKTIGAFNKRYPGRADNTLVKTVISGLIFA